MQFAIRPTLRNHTSLTRDSVIKLVASLVGRNHQVDLKDYDLLILVELYKVRRRPAGCRGLRGNGSAVSKRAYRRAERVRHERRRKGLRRAEAIQPGGDLRTHSKARRGLEQHRSGPPSYSVERTARRAACLPEQWLDKRKPRSSPHRRARSSFPESAPANRSDQSDVIRLSSDGMALRDGTHRKPHKPPTSHVA